MENEENQEQQCEEVDVISKIEELVDCELKQLSQGEVQPSNIDYFGKLIDIHKDIENERYWNAKKEVYKMRYNDYEGEYGNYEGDYSDSYGRRGVPGTGRGRRYRGPEEMIERMHEHYGDYSESRNAYSRGNYGAKGETIKSLDYMLKSVVQFMKMLEEDANSEEESQLIKKYARKISEM